MKFIKLISLTLLITLTISIISVSSLQVKSSRDGSVMNFLNGLFSKKSNEENNNNNNNESILNTNNELSNKAYRFYELAQNNTKTNNENPVENTKESNTTDKDGKKDEILEGLMQISSYEFQNNRRFPPIMLPKNKQIDIKTNSERFRINDATANKKSNSTDSKSSSNNNNKDENLNFWFRLSGRHIYYAADKSDINILGAIDIEKLSTVKKDEVSHPDRNCLTVIDHFNAEYTICAAGKPNTKQIRDKWYCKIAESLLIEDQACIEDKLGNFKNTRIEIENKSIQPIILVPEPSKICNQDFNYKANGNDWECTCAEGKEQSPIDLPNKAKSVQAPAAPLFDFEEIDAISNISSLDGSLLSKENVKIKHYKNAIRIFHTYFGKLVTLDGSVYHAEEIVFHSPAEHLIDGVRHDMEMQIVCYGQSKGDIAKQAVLSFVFEKKAGVYNKFIDDVDFFNLPSKNEPVKNIINNLYIPKVFYSSDDKDATVMKPFSFYTYNGSITAPPCTERTINYVSAETIPIGTTMISLLKEALKSEDDQVEADIQNNRNTQPINNRTVFYYDASNCNKTSGGAPEPEKKANGHFEKVKKTVTEYFHVNGIAPSGIPDSFVVSEEEAKGPTK